MATKKKMPIRQYLLYLTPIIIIVRIFNQYNPINKQKRIYSVCVIQIKLMFELSSS